MNTPTQKPKSQIIDYRLIPMQASHIDDAPRCPKCWLKNAKPGHFCRWNIQREGPRDPRPQPVRQPVYGRRTT